MDFQVNGATNENYLLNICGWAKGCKSGNSVCSTTPTTVFGTQQHTQLVKEQDTVKLVYGDGQACGNSDTYTSIIQFECDETQLGTNGPKLTSVSLFIFTDYKAKSHVCMDFTKVHLWSMLYDVAVTRLFENFHMVYQSCVCTRHQAMHSGKRKCCV